MRNQTARSLWGHLNDRKEYPRVSTQIRGQALLHQGPLSPGPSLWSFHQCCVELALKVWEIKALSAFFSQQVWSREVRAAANTAAGVLMVALAGKGQPNQDV